MGKYATTFGFVGIIVFQLFGREYFESGAERIIAAGITAGVLSFVGILVHRFIEKR